VRRPTDAVALGLGIAVFVPCAVVASSGRVGHIERTVFDAINGLPSSLSVPMRAVQYLGVLAVGPVVAVVALAFRRYRLTVAALLVTALKLGAERAVWNVLDIHRERPGTSVPGAIVRGSTPTTGVSFVSGHVMLVTALALVVTPYLRGGWRFVPWVIVVAVAFARVYLGAHSPLDVLGGAAAGLAIGGVVSLVIGIEREPPGDAVQGAEVARTA
jgi:undecaprenyl-diphosphatase